MLLQYVLIFGERGLVFAVCEVALAMLMCSLVDVNGCWYRYFVFGLCLGAWTGSANLQPVSAVVMTDVVADGPSACRERNFIKSIDISKRGN
jgi:hypothetical protein